LFGWFVALGYSTIASLEQPPIAPQKSVTEALDSYRFNRLITSLVTLLSAHSRSLRMSKNLGKQEVRLCVSTYFFLFHFILQTLTW
jgi:hypothetical protein